MSLASILSTTSHLSLTANNRVKCSITGHEMPADLNAVKLYLSRSKKLMKTREWYSADFSKYLPYIIEHKHDTRKLYCRLTKKKLNKIPTEIEKHCNGKKFQRLRKDFEESRKKRPHKTEENEIDLMEELFNDEIEESDNIEADDNEEEEEEEDSVQSDEDNHADLMGDNDDKEDSMIIDKKKIKMKKNTVKSVISEPSGEQLKAPLKKRKTPLDSAESRTNKGKFRKVKTN